MNNPGDRNQTQILGIARSTHVHRSRLLRGNVKQHPHAVKLYPPLYVDPTCAAGGLSMTDHRSVLCRGMSHTAA